MKVWPGAQREERIGSLRLWGYRQEGGLEKAAIEATETQG